MTVAEGRLIEQLDPGGLDAGERWLAVAAAKDQQVLVDDGVEVM